MADDKPNEELFHGLMRVSTHKEAREVSDLYGKLPHDLKGPLLSLLLAQAMDIDGLSIEEIVDGMVIAQAAVKRAFEKGFISSVVGTGESFKA